VIRDAKWTYLVMPKSAGLIISYVDGLLRIAFALLQVSIVKVGKHESRERARELFRELALLQVPWEALGIGFCSQLSPKREFSMKESTYCMPDLCVNAA
jgi:hypothetical protein